MKYATLTTDSGYTWSTDINGTIESIYSYFLGKYFDVGVYPEEKMEIVSKVSIFTPNGLLLFQIENT